MKKLTYIIPMAAAVLAGCGGSDSAPPPSLVAITSVNAPAIAGASMQSALSSGGVVASGIGSLSNAASPAGFTGGRSMAAYVHRVTAATVAVRPKIQTAVPPTDQACSVSGTVTLSGNIAVDNTLTPGDNVKGVFHTCDDGDGAVLDGTLNIDVHSFTGDVLTGLWVLGGDATMTSFAVTTDAGTDTGNGKLAIQLDTTQQPIVTGTLGGSGFSINDGTDTLNWQNLSADITLDNTNTPFGYTESASGSLSGSALGGRVDISTVEALSGTGQGPPSTGTLKITGLDGTSVQVVAIDNVNAQLLIDSNGDGTVDATQDVTWATLGL